MTNQKIGPREQQLRDMRKHNQRSVDDKRKTVAKLRRKIEPKKKGKSR